MSSPPRSPKDGDKSSTSILILYRSELFRDLFSRLLSRGRSNVTCQPLPTDGSVAAAAGEVTVVLETFEGDSELIHKVWTKLIQDGSSSPRLCAVDMARDQIVEYHRNSLGAPTSLSGLVRSWT